jgi:hypothetical protein
MMLRICVAAGSSRSQSLLDQAAAESDTPLSRHVTTTARAILAEAHGKIE